MKKRFQTKYLTMFCFLGLLAGLFCQGVSPVYEGFVNTANNYQTTRQIDFSTVEETYNGQFKGKNFFITLNGAYQKLMGARVLNERYKLDNGHLTYLVSEEDVQTIARNTVDFRNALRELNIPMVYVGTPSKLHPTDKQLPVNAYDYSNENADHFLEILKNETVTVLDLREKIAESGLEHYDLFYKTDHHWKAESGLWAAGVISDHLAEQDDGFRRDKALQDPSSYHFEVYENIFLGSAGRRVGSMYAGMDDFTVITPTFDTDFSFFAEDGEIVRSGSFPDVFIVRDLLYSEDPLLSNTYATYCGGGFSQMEIHNHHTGCSPKKILLIRDSFSDVLIPFLAMGYEQLDVLDLRYFDNNLMEYVKELSPDMVLIVYNPGAYESKNSEMFDFLK